MKRFAALLVACAALSAMAQTSPAPVFQEPPKVPPGMAAEQKTTDGAPAGESAGFCWLQTKLVRHGPTEQTVYCERKLSEAFGFYGAFVGDSTHYGEFYAGPTWTPVKGLQFGAGVGKENMPNSIRRNVWVEATPGDFDLYATFEKGGSGVWHKATAMYKFSSAVSIGAMQETGFSVGPRVEWNVIETFQLWVATPHQSGKFVPVGGIAITVPF